MEHDMQTESPESAARQDETHVISKQDLPLSCPMPTASQWNSHPRVFLKLDKNGMASCPYCGARYMLKRDG
jgi:uncharacterized Zn-finger protein